MLLTQYYWKSISEIAYYLNAFFGIVPITELSQIAYLCKQSRATLTKMQFSLSLRWHLYQNNYNTTAWISAIIMAG